MKFDMPTPVMFILSELNRNGCEAYIVGGCVRDALLDKTPNDYDICTSATPDEIIKAFPYEEIIPTGLKHGTVTILINDEPIEVTTYRIDGKYSDNRRPDEVKFTTNLVEDLKRRDFTINAMAYNPITWLVDPFDGQLDLKHKIIRCVGNPYNRFNEDGLRILRAIRFASQLGFTIDSTTSDAIRESKHLLDNISRERIQSELCKILNSSQCGNHVLREYSDVICQFIPEVQNMIGFEQNNPYHLYDVWEHTLHCMSHIKKEDDIIVRLAILLHDIGKPHCYSVDEQGIGHFYGHADVSAKMAQQILSNLKFSNEIIDNTVQLISYHDAQLTAKKPVVKRLLNKLGEKQLRRLLVLRRCDIGGQEPTMWKVRLETVCDIEMILDQILKENECFQLKDLAINGKDLIEIGLPQGKLVGMMLNILLNLVISDSISNDKESLLNYAKSYIE